MRPTYRIAVVGSGPSGMYALEHLVKNKHVAIDADLFERLPAPWGLVRYGVAPDHPEKKLISNRLYSNIISRANVRYFGNVEIGRDISNTELASWYDGVIYASGANSDNALEIPGEELTGSWSAREFVAWYNGHPDYSHLKFDLSCPRAVIVGNGNVALDVARILTLPIEELRKTDIADHALDALENSRIQEVVILGRRGYKNGAFNNPELEELLHLDNIQVQVEDPEFLTDDESELQKLSWEARRKVETLRQLHKKKAGAVTKRIIFKFLSSPTALLGEDRLQHVQVKHNVPAHVPNGKQRVASDQFTSIDAGILFRATGYRGTPLPELPFDSKKAVIENVHGRVTDNGVVINGIYCTGWIKRGARGVIGTNKQCAGETVACLIDDLRLTNTSRALSPELVLSKIKERKPDFVTLADWLTIDRAEKERGASQKRPRSKLCTTGDMLRIARANSTELG